MCKITSIERQVKNKNRVSIFVDGEYFGSLDEKTFVKSTLKTGDTLVSDTWNTLQREGECESALNKAIAYISKIMRSESQVKRYLEKKGFHEEPIDHAVEKMKNYKYIDDEAYAKMILSHQINVKRVGQMAIRHALRQKGISGEISDKVLETYEEEEELQNAIKHAQKLYNRYKNLDDKYKRKSKISQNMARRGFSWDIIEQAINRIEE
jgi:regulatory protein